MSDNYLDWKLYTKNNPSKTYEPVAQVLSFVSGIDQSQIIVKALDGTIYTQNIGTGNAFANITIFCTRDEKHKIDEAAAAGSYMKVVYRTNPDTWYGFLEGMPQWKTEYPGVYYSAEVKFLIDWRGDN